MLTEAVNELLAGDLDAGKAMLRDYINATIMIQRLAKKLKKTWILHFIMVINLLRAVLIVIVLLLHLSVISFGPVPPMRHGHTSEDHHYNHQDDHDTGNDFASLITHSAPPLQSPIG